MPAHDQNLRNPAALAKCGLLRPPSINEASTIELESICDLDAERAQKLVLYRRTVGRICCWYQLKEIGGFDDALIDSLKRCACI